MASDPSTPTTPTSPNDDREATKEWLETILETYHKTLDPNSEPDVELREWSVNPASGGEREGYLSEQLSVGVSYGARGRDHHAHLLAKLLPQDPFNRAFVIETLFDLREINFYSEIKPALEGVERQYLTEDSINLVWAPELYYAKHKMAAESILVLADMCQRGYKMQDLTEGLTLSQAESALTTMANIQAASLALQIKEGKPLQERYPYLLSMEQAVESFNCLVDRGLPLLLKFLESRKDRAAVREGLRKYSGHHRAVEVLRSILAPSDKLNTLVHCDFWSNNLLFKKDGDTTRCCVIDWQTVMYGRPAIDVAMLICTSLEASQRRKHEAQLLSAYWDAFTSRLAKFGIEKESIKYTEDDLKEDFKAAQAMSGLVVVGSVDIALGNKAREERVLELLSDLMKAGVL
ncbi:uncharacterized protein [Procambarus clarkii]|uniref:uncharacterized protein n=1 Tax=Procambarus clarkii TaxID=6728 RepID=UPI001E677DF6|nr:uncharacterized protein LOC123745991 [Procambarus clarkii]XP_045583053.1 uncharacterized protein LOC123745991 [Procambarus clarkii]XP_045583054.1 uncharacterized protein LOC123745991 [Procambarus clarkii]XP_045583055.1 uncharacterized protein LOC123745991 [Procambarus clarkii]